MRGLDVFDFDAPAVKDTPPDPGIGLFIAEYKVTRTPGLNWD